MEISASIVTYFSGPIINNCLEHLTRSTQRSLEIIVFDNASEDNTQQELAHWRDKIRIIKSPENIGFGAGHNKALQDASGRYFLIQNPDVELPPGALDALAQHLDLHPECGSVSPLLKEDNCDFQCFAKSYPGHRYTGKTFKRLPGQIASLKGACMLVRAEVFRAIGGFDPRYFLYAEDLDLSLEIRKNGYELHCLESLRVRHIGGFSERTYPPSIVAAKKHLGLLLFYRKHYPWPARFFLNSRDFAKSTWRLVTLVGTQKPHGLARKEEHRGRLRAIRTYLSGQTRL
jgi:GT2 family glycosyltransferase